MLQQTRIAAVLPYYERFLRNFPTVHELAAASQDEVLKSWSGLGYYSRARNLHRAAKELVAHHDGTFPRDAAAALALPGIGNYTAAAILSIACDVPLAVLDGNVARVLARLGAIRGDLREPRRWRALQENAQRLLAVLSPGDWNQALMELGETVCTPRTPRCAVCPVKRWCCALQLEIVHQVPEARRKRAPVSQRIAAAVLLDPRGRTLLVKEPGQHDHVLFSRMWQFPAVEAARDAASELALHLKSDLGISVGELSPLAPQRHGVTFRRITLLPFLARVSHLPRRSNARSVPLANIGRVPISSATRKIAAAAQAATLLPRTAAARKKL
jgi:A/G-specific adenine glycosylase